MDYTKDEIQDLLSNDFVMGIQGSTTDNKNNE